MFINMIKGLFSFYYNIPDEIIEKCTLNSSLKWMSVQMVADRGIDCFYTQVTQIWYNTNFEINALI